MKMANIDAELQFMFTKIHVCIQKFMYVFKGKHDSCMHNSRPNLVHQLKTV